MSNEYRDWLRDECDELQSRIAELEAENALIHEEMDTKNMASSRALDELWGIIILNKKPDYGDWEYPMMAMRHIVIEFEKLQARIAELEAKNTQLSNEIDYLQDNLIKPWTRNY